jgi:hypothetical protein
MLTWERRQQLRECGEKARDPSEKHAMPGMRWYDRAAQIIRGLDLPDRAEAWKVYDSAYKGG